MKFIVLFFNFYFFQSILYYKLYFDILTKFKRKYLINDKDIILECKHSIDKFF
jgi:hypothetical protein